MKWKGSTTQRTEREEEKVHNGEGLMLGFFSAGWEVGMEANISRKDFISKTRISLQ